MGVRSVLLLFSPGRLVLAAAVLVAGYLLFSAGGNVLASFRIADDEARLKSQVAELHAQEEQLKQIRDYLRTNEYVEYMARRVFGLVKPGETLVDVDAPDLPTASAETPGRPWWETLFGR